MGVLKVYRAAQLFTFAPSAESTDERKARCGRLDQLLGIEGMLRLKLCFIDIGFRDDNYMFFVDSETGKALVVDPRHGGTNLQYGTGYVPLRYNEDIYRANFEIAELAPNDFDYNYYWWVIRDRVVDFIGAMQGGDAHFRPGGGHPIRDIPSFRSVSELRMKLELVGK